MTPSSNTASSVETPTKSNEETPTSASTAPTHAASAHISSGRRYDTQEATDVILGALANRPKTVNGPTISLIVPANAVIALLEALDVVRERPEVRLPGVRGSVEATAGDEHPESAGVLRGEP